jgi:RNA polymerase sigma-70 factor, ECF subfamily
MCAAALINDYPRSRPLETVKPTVITIIYVPSPPVGYNFLQKSAPLTSSDYASTVKVPATPMRLHANGLGGRFLVPDIYQNIAAEIPRLRRYARSLARDATAADDLVQDCLARALGKLHLWQEGSDLRAWLFTILHNQYVTQVRRAVREGPMIGLNESDPMLTRAPHQPRRLELRDLERAVGRLPAEQRAVILLVGLDGMPYEEAAQVLHVPVGTVRSRLSRGREALRRLMGMVPEMRPAPPTLHQSGTRFFSRRSNSPRQMRRRARRGGQRRTPAQLAEAG